jgi:Carboxypeptidase regulatory-like domain
MRRALGILFALLLVAPMFAQQSTGNLFGTITDPDGNPLPGVSITLKGPQTGTLTAVTSAEGLFRFMSLFPGRDYQLRMELAGFKTRVESGIIVSLGKNTELSFIMELGALEEEVTVTAVSPVVETKKTTLATTIPYESLQSLPSARDPWVILQMTPSIQMDRENVGGNESGQQASYVALGGGTWNDTWTLDGVNITDPAAMGASPTYYDYDVFSEVNVTLGGADVDQHTAGIGLNLVSRRGGNRISLDGRFYYTESAFQSEPHGDTADELAVIFPGYGYNQIRTINDYGFNVGGPVWKDKAWLWGSYGVQNIKTRIINGSKDDTDLNNYAAKLNLQLIPENRFELFYHLGDKKKFGRSSSTANPSGWNQHGAYHFGSPILKIQDEHTFGSNFFVSAKYGYTDAGFGMWPANDEDLTKVRFYNVERDLYTNTQTWFLSKRPNKQLTIHGTYFNDNLLGASHEFKVGFEYIDRRDVWSSGYPGNLFVNTNYNTVQVDINGDGTRDIPVGYNRIGLRRGTTLGGPEGNYHYSGFLQDTISFGRFNLKLGVRYDLQQCWFKGSTYETIFSQASDSLYFKNYYDIQQKFLGPGVPDKLGGLLPGVKIPAVGTDTTIAWKDFSPRVGLTWDVSGNGKTIAKLSGAIYGGRMGSYYAYPWYQGGGGGWMNFWWKDNGDGVADMNELYWANNDASRTLYPIFDAAGTFKGNWDEAYGLMWAGYDPLNPTQPDDTPYYTYDSDWSSDKTYEAIVTLEREIIPDFGVGLDFTWRKYSNFWYNWPYNTTLGGELITRADYIESPNAIPGNVSGVDTGDAAGRHIYVWREGVSYVDGWEVTNTPSDYYDTYWGLDLRWNKRLTNKWMLTGSVTYQNQTAHWGATYPLDPTSQWAEDGQEYAYFIGASSGKINQPVFSRWMFKVQGLYQLPYGFNVSAVFNAREGHILPKGITIEDADAPNPESNNVYIRTENFGNSRLPTMWNVDMRLEKVLNIQDTGRIYLMVDCFNIFNNNILNRQYEVNPGTLYLPSYELATNVRSGEPNEVLNPRIFRFGVRFAI